MMKREDEDVDKMKMGEATVSLYGRIEGYDISHISGTSTVASMVVFENGAPAKAEYRKFRSEACLARMTSLLSGKPSCVASVIQNGPVLTFS